jgi:hypothetical protein
LDTPNSMSCSTKLHWTQRIALVRHNLHASSRSGDFGFFRTLQVTGFVEGTNHVATLSAELGDEGDIVLAAMDNLNAGLAYVHQDAFKNVYENLKNNVRAVSNTGIHKSKLYVDITMQKNMADMAIDKFTSSAIALINQQPEKSQDLAANVWITGTTMIVDSIEVALKEMDAIEHKLDDFIRLEQSWSSVKGSVVCAVTGLNGVFRLMDPNTSPAESQKSSPRNSSIASASGAVFRRLSNAFAANGNTSRSSSITSVPSMPMGTRASSFSSTAPVYRTPDYMRNSLSVGCPTSLRQNGSDGELYERHTLATIPPTPADNTEGPDPFDNSAPSVPELPQQLLEVSVPALSIEALEARRVSQVVV